MYLALRAHCVRQQRSGRCFDEKERAKGPKSAFPQQGSPKSDRRLVVLAQKFSLCLALVLGSKQSASLQLRNNQINKLFNGPRTIDR
jgi:hypothetical protein